VVPIVVWVQLGHGQGARLALHVKDIIDIVFHRLNFVEHRFLFEHIIGVISVS
jgi:hypothetical protein